MYAQPFFSLEFPEVSRRILARKGYVAVSGKGGERRPFDIGTDYIAYVDGKSRLDGTRSLMGLPVIEAATILGAMMRRLAVLMPECGLASIVTWSLAA